MQLLLPYTPLHTPSTHATQSGKPISTWVGSLTNAQTAPTFACLACNQLLQQSIQASSAHQLDQADSIFASARTAPCHSAGFCQNKPSTDSSSRQWQHLIHRNQECRSLHAQWHRAERLSPAAPSTITLLAQLQAMFTARKRSFISSPLPACSSQIPVNSTSKLMRPSCYCHLSCSHHQPGSPTLGISLPLLHKQPPTCHPHSSHSWPLALHAISLGLQRLQNGKPGALQGYSSETC